MAYSRVPDVALGLTSGQSVHREYDSLWSVLREGWTQLGMSQDPTITHSTRLDLYKAKLRGFSCQKYFNTHKAVMLVIVHQN